jgi:hypothetical protein
MPNGESAKLTVAEAKTLRRNFPRTRSTSQNLNFGLPAQINVRTMSYDITGTTLKMRNFGTEVEVHDGRQRGRPGNPQSDNRPGWQRAIRVGHPRICFSRRSPQASTRDVGSIGRDSSWTRLPFCYRPGRPQIGAGSVRPNPGLSQLPELRHKGIRFQKSDYQGFQTVQPARLQGLQMWRLLSQKIGG